MAAEVAQISSLAGLMEDLGYGCAQTEAVFKDVLKHFPSVNEASIAQVVGMMARTNSTLGDRSGTQVCRSPAQHLAEQYALAEALALGHMAPYMVFVGLQSSLATALGGLKISDSAGVKSWNVEIVMEALKAALPGLSIQSFLEIIFP